MSDETVEIPLGDLIRFRKIEAAALALFNGTSQ